MSKLSSLFGKRLRLFTILALSIGLLILVGTVAANDTARLTLKAESSPAGEDSRFPISAESFLGNWDSHLASPRDLDSDNAGNIYVIGRRRSQVRVFSPDGNRIDSWGVKGRGATQVYRPEDIAVWDHGNVTVLVADTSNHRIQIFNGSGVFQQTIGQRGVGAGQFDRPQGIDVAADGTFYVADTWNHRIQKFSADGSYLTEWGSEGTGPGQFNYPSGVSIGRDGLIYVADSNNHRVQVFDANGNFVRMWGQQGTGPGQLSYPADLHAGSDGYIYVSDTFNGRIQKYGAYGGYMATLFSPEITRPNGLLLQDDGTLQVAGIHNGNIQTFWSKTVWLRDGQQQTLQPPAGNYDVVAGQKAGWQFDTAACNAASQSITGGLRLTLAAGDGVDCTYTFTK